MSNEKRHRDETRVRRELERAIEGKFDATTWNKFVADGYVRDYLEERDMEWPELERTARTALQHQHEHEREVLAKWGMSEQSQDGDSGSDKDYRKGSEAEPSFDVRLPRREQKRAAILLEIQMRQAAERPDVKHFRRERLGDCILSVEEADTYFGPHPRESIKDRALARLGQRLESDYSWHKEDAAWFVLTGESPALRPLAVDFFISESEYAPNRGELVLRVAPWITADAVKKTYLQARDQIRGGSGPGTVGLRRLELLRFVEAAISVSSEPLTYETLRQMWNEKYPHWDVPDRRNFRRDYCEARQEVLYPEYHPPRRESTPRAERKKAWHRKWTKQAEAIYEKAMNRSPKPF